MNDIDNLIDQIKTLLNKNHKLLKVIKYPKTLIRGLTELSSLIEMDNIKTSIVNQIKFLITNQVRTNCGYKFENHMLHCAIVGNPGCGKTTVAKILATIWTGIGFVNSNIMKEKKNNKIDYKREHFKKLIDKQSELITKIRKTTIQLKPQKDKTKWDDLIRLTRTLRFDHDKLLKEINMNRKKINEVKCKTDEIEPKFVIATREDLVGEFLGHTAPKTLKILESAKGGVLFIDEAYSICNNDNNSGDKFGEECLSVINEFMSNNPNDIIVIFAGYKDKLMNTIFKVQPGLLRRCTNFYEIKDYTKSGLAKIFKLQMEKYGWKIKPGVNLEKLFQNQVTSELGGFTEKMAFFTKLVYSDKKFTSLVEQNEFVDDMIDESILTKALDMLEKNSVSELEKDTIPVNIYC